MTNLEKYNQAFAEALEDVFDIMMDTDGIIDFSSYEKSKEILTQNYGIVF